VVFKIESGSKLKSAIIVPTKPIVHRGEKLRTLLTKPPPAEAPNNPSPATGNTDPFGSGKKGRTRVTKESRQTSAAARSKDPVEVPAGSQAVPCSCGETFVIRRKDLGQVLTCAGCGQKARAVEGCDPQTLAPILRMRPV